VPSAPIHYAPPDLVQWLSPDLQSEQKARAKPGDGRLRDSLRQAATAAAGFGRTAMGELEYLLDEEGFSIPGLTQSRRIEYRDIREIRREKKDRFRLITRSGDLAIDPVAHLVAGPVKAPVGWLRNGVEVAYFTLIQEISARARLDIIEAE
jgi:hypothetical protein